MAKRFWLLLVLAVIVCAAVPSNAADKEIKGHVSFGGSFPQGGASDNLDDGWALHGGATWFSPGRPIGLRLDLGVDWWDLSNAALSQIDTVPATPNIIDPPDNGYGRVWSGTADFLWEAQTKGAIGFYLVGGVGVYYGSWDLSEYGYATGYWCDWWTGICYPGVTTGEYLIESGSTWEWGLNAGLGMTFRLAEGELFLEATYHWLDTENSFEYMPITLGYRW